MPSKITSTTPITQRVVHKLGTKVRGVENGLSNTGYMEQDITQVLIVLERKMDIIMLQIWSTRKVVQRHIIKAAGEGGIFS